MREECEGWWMGRERPNVPQMQAGAKIWRAHLGKGWGCEQMENTS